MILESKLVPRHYLCSCAFIQKHTPSTLCEIHQKVHAPEAKQLWKCARPLLQGSGGNVLAPGARSQHEIAHPDGKCSARGVSNDQRSSDLGVGGGVGWGAAVTMQTSDFRLWIRSPKSVVRSSPESSSGGLGVRSPKSVVRSPKFAGEQLQRTLSPKSEVHSP